VRISGVNGAIAACPKHSIPLSKTPLTDGSERTALDGRALGFARWDKLWAKPVTPPKFIFKIMFLHDFFGYLPLRQFGTKLGELAPNIVPEAPGAALEKSPSCELDETRCPANRPRPQLSA
jgi:hypothetical protein